MHDPTATSRAGTSFDDRQRFEPGTALLATRALVVGLGPRRLVVPDLDLWPGQCWAVLGANGAGKTSLLETLAALRAPLAGELTWEGVAGRRIDARSWRRLCGVMPAFGEDPFDEPVLDRVAKGALPAGRWMPGRDTRAQAAAMLARLDLAGFGTHRWQTLSAGERQRALLAQQLLQRSRALLLDEPIAHQDPHHQDLIGGLLAQYAVAGSLVIAVAHDPDWALAYCSHALLLGLDGGCRAVPASELLDQRVLRGVYASGFERVELGGRARLVRQRRD